MRRHDDHADGSGIQSGQAPQACLAADRAKKPVCLRGPATASPATACPLISWGRHPRTPERLCGLLRALRVPPSAGWWTTTRAPPKPLRPHARASRPGAPRPSPVPPPQGPLQGRALHPGRGSGPTRRPSGAPPTFLVWTCAPATRHSGSEATQQPGPRALPATPKRLNPACAHRAGAAAPAMRAARQHRANIKSSWTG